MRTVLFACACLLGLADGGAVSLDVGFVRGLIADVHGAHQDDEHGSLRSEEEYLNFFADWLSGTR